MPSSPEPWCAWTWDESTNQYYRGRIDATGDWEYEFLPTRGAQASGGSPIDTEENASEPETPAPETDTGESDPEGQETEPSPTIKYAPVVSHLDLRYRVRKSRDWSPGTVFQIYWSKPLHRVSSTECLDGQTPARAFGVPASFFSVRRFVVVATDAGSSTCVRIASCSKHGFKPLNHGIIHETGRSRPIPLKGELRLGFPPVRVRLSADGEGLSPASRINYSKLVTIEHNVPVLFIGRVKDRDFHIVSEAVDACWNSKKPGRHSIVGSHKHQQQQQESRYSSDGKEDGQEDYELMEADASVTPRMHRAQEEFASKSTAHRNRPEPVDVLYDEESGNKNDDDNESALDTSSSVPDPVFNQQTFSDVSDEPPQKSAHGGSPPNFWGRFRSAFSEAGPADGQPSQQQATRAVPVSGAQRPVSRDEFEVAIVCALTLEVNAVAQLFEHHWDYGDEAESTPYGKAWGDTNAYSTGRIGRHDVVVAHMSGMGKVRAAKAAAHLGSSWRNIRLVLVVGICGAVPFPGGDIGNEIILGDVVISKGVVQYDLGRQLPDRFIYKNTLEESLGRPCRELATFLAKLESIHPKENLRTKAAQNLNSLQRDPRLKATYPGAEHDFLFEAGYSHLEDGKTCDKAGCRGKLVPRERLMGIEGRWPAPLDIHFGLVASGDTVMKSGLERDRIAEEQGVIAFEMEGAGVWDEFPCLVIKGACDYADSHKTKVWQYYAAATAAACAKALLQLWVPSSR